MSTVYRIDHKITCLGPLAHGTMGTRTGNASLIRRTQILRGGQVLDVPCVSAGALRGVVRRLLWRETFDGLDLSRETVAGWDRLYAALANGGTIEAAERRVSPDVIRQRRRELPVLSLLGAALYTSHLAGRARVSDSLLVCAEVGTGEMSCWDLVAEESRVRHADSEEQDPDLSGVGPMPTTIEVIVACATLRGHAQIGGDLEASAWAHGLDLVRYLGGHSGQGFGEVQILHDGDGALYVAWLAEHGEALRASLLRLCEELQKAPKKAPKKAAAAPEAAPEPDAPEF